MHGDFWRSEVQHNKWIHEGNPFREDVTDMHPKKKTAADIIIFIQETDISGSVLAMIASLWEGFDLQTSGRCAPP